MLSLSSDYFCQSEESLQKICRLGESTAGWIRGVSVNGYGTRLANETIYGPASYGLGGFLNPQAVSVSLGIFNSIYLLLPRKSEIRLKSENLHPC